MLLSKHPLLIFFSISTPYFGLAIIYTFQRLFTCHFCLPEFYLLFISSLKCYSLYKTSHHCHKLKLPSSIFPSSVTYHTILNSMKVYLSHIFHIFIKRCSRCTGIGYNSLKVTKEDKPL